MFMNNKRNVIGRQHCGDVNLLHLSVLVEHDSISAAVLCGSARRRPQCECPD
jgi:hypothetical protein